MEIGTKVSTVSGRGRDHPWRREEAPCEEEDAEENPEVGLPVSLCLDPDIGCRLKNGWAHDAFES